ncbi:heme-binding protein [[Mycobacterium] wendilense]|uniref:Heme-binding protein n=1 Tax=[Mycobacterium] wendilense TaxID=3064284 RepID=A0ABM9MGZ5_9MYCO|nr:heme-binding protein [Mycolicibacterium sp. MU0050]CAJ1584923.1 heme-binding protein [Mycolicibacterium sp. MU0050]
MSVFVRSAAFAAVAVGALFAAAPVALAEDPPPPPPYCSVGDMTGIMSGVSASMSAYMFTHPQVNAFFTSLKGQPKEQRAEQISTYLDANPQVRAELTAIRQPMMDFRARCGVPLTD